MAAIVEGDFAPSIDNGTWTAHNGTTGKLDGFAARQLSELSGWQVAITILLVLVAYDQCKPLILLDEDSSAYIHIVAYLKRKGSIAGPMFKIPFMGPFIQALYPKFDAYLAQWASGPLSCVSVFHK